MTTQFWMEDIQEAFTRRMLRRVSSRRIRDRNGAFDTSNEDLQRRYSILKAIDDPSIHRASWAKMEDQGNLDHSHDLHGRTLDPFENCRNNNKTSVASYNRSDEGIERSPIVASNKSFTVRCKKSFATANGNRRIDTEASYCSEDNCCSLDDSSAINKKEVQARGSTEESPKTMERLRNVVDENRETAARVIREPMFENNSEQATRSSTGSLSAAINELEVQIRNLEMRPPKSFTTEAIVEKCEKIYPDLEDIEFEPTGHTPQKNIRTRCTNSQFREITSGGENIEDNCCYTSEIETGRSETYARERSDEIVTYHQTPKSQRKMPIMESTRKNSHSDSTKIKFPTPSRVESTISTIAVSATPGSDDCQYGAREPSSEIGSNFNETIPYEVERFLEEALGDELYNTTVTYAASEPRDRTNSHFNASELISEDRTPLKKRIIKALRPPMTEPPPKKSGTLNRSMSIYRSLSQRIKKKFRAALKAKENVLAPPLISSDSWETDRIRQLLQEISVQQTVMNQAAKALNVCHTMKEFTESSERVESERLLLLAGLRRKTALEEMKRITSEENTDGDKEFYGERGEITIKDMSLSLRECNNRATQDGETVEWFVVVVSQGLEVWATHAVSCPANDSRLCLPEAISMPNLTPSFKILVEVYSMKLKKATYNHEEKYRIDNRHKRSSSCPPFFVSPTKILKKAERPLSPKIGYAQASKNRNSSFVLCGLVELFLHDLSLSSPWPLMLVPANSILQGTIDFSLSCRLHLSVNHEGFLNHGDEAGGFAIWNRRWCVLKGHTLMFWNYPREQETKEPLTIIELINCISKRIGTADRTICAKPRTLLVETVRRKSATDRNSMIVECRSSCTIVRNLLSCDSVHELMEWSTKLNHVIFALREWNVIGTRTQPQVSDL